MFSGRPIDASLYPPYLDATQKIAQLEHELREVYRQLDAAREALAEIREVWAGSECGQPVHAQEAYAIHLCKQMYELACAALAAQKGEK